MGYPPMRVRTCEFGRAALMFGADLPRGLDLYGACATWPLEVRVHDRVIGEEPEEIPDAAEEAGGDSGGAAGMGAEASTKSGTEAKAGAGIKAGAGSA